MRGFGWTSMVILIVEAQYFDNFKLELAQREEKTLERDAQKAIEQE